MRKPKLQINNKSFKLLGKSYKFKRTGIKKFWVILGIIILCLIILFIAVTTVIQMYMNMSISSIVNLINDEQKDDTEQVIEEQGCTCECKWVYDNTNFSDGYSTGNLDGDSIPEFQGRSLKVVTRLIGSALVSDQYFDVRPGLMMAQSVSEASRTAFESSEYDKSGANMFGVLSNDDTTNAETAAMRYASNFRSSTWGRNYDKVLESYGQGSTAQINQLQFTNYCVPVYVNGCGYEMHGRYFQTTEEASAHYSEYMANICESNGFSVFDDPSMIQKYIEKNDLEGRYDRALSVAKDKYSQYMNSEPNNEVALAGSSSNGHWECDCNIPCTYCKCHDNDFYDADGNLVSNGGAVGADGVNGMFTWPIGAEAADRFQITSVVGNRETEVEGASTNHAGVDIGVPTGTKVLAIADGEVVNVKNTPFGDRGSYVIIKHSESLYSLYQHLWYNNTINNIYSNGLVNVGDKVEAGQLIALSGSTGIGYAHLHFEIGKNNGSKSDEDFHNLMISKDDTLSIYLCGVNPNQIKFEGLSFTNMDITQLSEENEERVRSWWGV